MELDQTDRAVKNWGMDLTYPAEAEAFRAEIRTWLEDHLPAGWFDEGFEMTADEKKAFNEDWTQELFDGGWICATWPTEYGGKGLSTIQGVVLAEEFAATPRACASRNSCSPRNSLERRRRCAPTSSATRWSVRRS